MKIKSFKVLFAICLILGLATLAFGQRKFKVVGECGHGCDTPHTTLVHFDYGDGLQITADFDSEFGVSITKDNFSTFSNVFLVQGMGKYFVNKVNEKRVDSNLNSILLKVYKIGEYCIDQNIKGNYSETGKFAPLAELRQYLKIGSTTAIVKKKPTPTKPSNAAISESDLREQMMSDGLRNALEGCEGMSVSIEQTKFDLNRDGQMEIIITAESGCWGARGAKAWVYQNLNGKLKPLLAGIDGIASVEKTITKKFRDVVVSSTGFIDVYTYIYKYNGREYEYFISKRYQRNKSGKLVLKETNN